MNRDLSIRVQPLPAAPHRAAAIPPLERTEAAALATVELGHLTASLRSLAPEEWRRATICPGWTVKDVVAHLCGLNEVYARWGAGSRQVWAALRRRDRHLLDAVNEAQVAARANRTPAELIAELTALGPTSVRVHYLIPGVLRRLPVVLPGFGVRRLDYVLNELFSREIWLHHLDIAQAAGREPELTADHDGRIVALVVRDLDPVVASAIGPEATVRLDLTGPAGGFWDLGAAGPPEATIRLDALDLIAVASGRATVIDLRSAGRVEVTGNEAIGWRALTVCRTVF